ncbi:MAG: DUF1501 domain-containing protein [Archangium sp.]|nr:DUF1501 domain-containing protein [Archangium sp.]
MSVSRRDLFKFLGAAGVTASLGPAFGQTASIDPNHLFLFVVFGGGWDHPMSLDPRHPSLDAMKDNTGIEMAWNALPAPFNLAAPIQASGSNLMFGPAIGGMQRHWDKMCVVRGISMDTLSHPTGARYFSTGKPPSGLAPRGNSAGAEVVDQLHRTFPNRLGQLANLSIDVDNYYTGNTTEVRAFRASALSPISIAASFSRGLTPEGDYSLLPAAARENLLALHRQRQFCDPSNIDASGVMTRVRQAQAKNEQLFSGSDIASFTVRLQNYDEWKLYGPSLVEPPAPGTPGLAAFFARQALARGMSNSVTVLMQSELDTHTSIHPTQQPTRQKAGWDALATLIDDLAVTNHPALTSDKLLDHTTIVVYSEFTRTALRNAAGGRDHSLTNSAVLLGKGIRGNTVIGASSDNGMQPQAVNLSTGAVDPAGDVVRPEHVLATVLECGGYDRNHLLVPGIERARI